MRGKNRKDMRKRAAGVLAVIIAAAMLISLAAPFFVNAAELGAFAGISTVNAVNVDQKENETNRNKQPDIENANFDINAEIGYGGRYIAGASAPVSVMLKNNGGAFKGELQLLVKTNELWTYATDEQDNGLYTVYYLKVDLAAGASQSFTMEIPMETAESSLSIGLADDSGKTVMRKSFPMEAMNPESFVIGVLSSDFDAMKSIKAIKTAGKNIYRTDDQLNRVNESVLELTGSSFPSNDKLFAAFNAIVINDYDTSRLEEQQISALKSWLSRGGMLILGGGPNAAKVYSGISDIEEIGTGELFEISEYPELNTAMNASLEQYGPMLAANVIIDGADSYMNESGRELTVMKKYDGGVIVAHAFDMALSPFDRSAELSELLSQIYMQADTLTELRADNQDLYTLRNFYSIPSNGKSGIIVIMAIVAIYLIFIGPVAYFVLKKLDKREIGWVLIPAASLIFMLVVSLASSRSYYNSSFVNMVGNVSVESGMRIGQADIKAVVKSPWQGNVAFEMDEQTEFRRNDNNHYGYYGSFGNSRMGLEPGDIISRIQAGGNTAIEFIKSARWQDNLFNIRKTVDLGEGIICNVSMSGKNVTADITNKSGINFTDAKLLFGGSIYNIGNIPDGERIKFEEEMAVGGYDTYSIAREAFYGESDYLKMADIIREAGYTPDEQYKIARRVDMLESVMDNSYSKGTFTSGIYLIAFNDTAAFEAEKRVNGKKAIEYTDCVYVIDGNLRFGGEAPYEIPVGMMAPIEVNSGDFGSYEMYNNTLYAYDDERRAVFDIKYFAPADSSLNSFTVSFESKNYEKAEIYNEASGEWETLVDGEYKNANDYVNADDEMGYISIKIELEAGGQSVPAPQLGLKGGE